MAAEPCPWEESLVLVCGPPCTGKTVVAQQHAAYHRLSFDSGEKQGTLRSKAKLVKRELGSKGRVCLDDQHKDSDTRKNIIGWSCAQQALCVWCEPEGGRTQCIWANEWNMVATDEAGAVGGEYMPLALSTASSDEAYGNKHRRSLESWFPSGSAVVPMPPSEAELLAEGFHRVLRMLRLPLCPELHGTFHRAGLVIDAHAVLEDRSPSGGVEPIPGAAASISQYLRTNPSARVVLLVQPTQLFQWAAMDPAANERELSTRAQALEEAALSGVRALAKQVAASGHSLHYVWLTPVSKPLPPVTTQDTRAEAEAPGSVSTLPVSLSAEHRAASARYLACAPPSDPADGRLPSCPLAWAVRRHRLALGALLYVRGATAPSAAAAAAVASKLYEGVRQLEGREFLNRQGSVPPEPIQLTDLPRFLHPFATTAANQPTSSAQRLGVYIAEPLVQEGALYGRVHGMAPCNAGASSGETAAEAVAATGGAGATGSAAGSDGFRTTHWTSLEESAAPPPAAAPVGPAAVQTASSAALSWVSSDLPSQLAYPNQLKNATGIVSGGKLLTGCECRPAAPGEAFCGAVLVAKCKGSSTETYDLELHIAQPPSAALIVRRSCGCVDFKDKVVRHIRQEPGYLCKHLTALLIWAIQRRDAAANGDGNNTCDDGACNGSCRRDAPGGDASSGDSRGGAVGVRGGGGGAGPSSSMIGGAAAVAGAAAASGEGTGQGVRAGGSGGGHGPAAAPQCGGSSGAGGPRAATVPAVRRMPSSFTGGSSKKPRGESSNDGAAASTASAPAVGGRPSSAPSAAARVLAADAKLSKAKTSAKPVTIDLTDDDPPKGAVGSTRAGPSASRAGSRPVPRCELEQPITAKLLEEIARATLATHGVAAKVTAPPVPAAVAASTAATASSSSATVGAAPAAPVAPATTAAAAAAVAAAPARYGGSGGGAPSALAADVLLTQPEPRAVAAKSAEQGGSGESEPLAVEPSGLGVPKKSLYGMLGGDLLMKPEVPSASRGAATSTQARPSSNAHFFDDDDD